MQAIYQIVEILQFIIIKSILVLMLVLKSTTLEKITICILILKNLYNKRRQVHTTILYLPVSLFPVVSFSFFLLKKQKETVKETREYFSVKKIYNSVLSERVPKIYYILLDFFVRNICIPTLKFVLYPNTLWQKKDTILHCSSLIKKYHLQFIVIVCKSQIDNKSSFISNFFRMKLIFNKNKLYSNLQPNF